MQLLNYIKTDNGRQFTLVLS